MVSDGEDNTRQTSLNAGVVCFSISGTKDAI